LEPSKFRRCGDLGTTRDGATVIEGELKSGWEAWCLFVNLARQCENHSRMYQYLECIKDGQITTQKYQGKSLEFDEPHIVVFANWPPHVNQVSLDRWKIYELINGELVGVDTYKLLRDQSAIAVDGNEPTWSGLV